jgi:hypothetical protein
MPTYWYASANKLEALGASDPGLLGRLRSNVKLGLGGVGLEVGLDAQATRSLNRTVEKAEKQLRREGEISNVADFESGAPPAVYFQSHGPASRAVMEGIFWTAVLDKDVAVLLVGSASNAIGVKSSPVGSLFSPTLDPVDAARYLTRKTMQDDVMRPVETMDSLDEVRDPLEQDIAEGAITYAWSALFGRNLEMASNDIDALPRARSISQYVGRYWFDETWREWAANIRWLVLGTPVYVTQVSKIRN